MITLVSSPKQHLPKHMQHSVCMQLGSVAGLVIQANGMLNFKDDLRFEGLLYHVLQWTSVHTKLGNSTYGHSEETRGEPKPGCLRKSPPRTATENTGSDRVVSYKYLTHNLPGAYHRSYVIEIQDTY